MNRNIIAFLCLLSTLPMSLLAQQQFDGIVGTPGCKAIQFTDSRFRDWAKTCTVTRGFFDIAKPKIRTSFLSFFFLKILLIKPSFTLYRLLNKT